MSLDQGQGQRLKFYLMSFNVKVISTLNDRNAHLFSMFCDLCVTRMVRF